MSETDSFIQEVSEEVRRDRLFKLMKKYGWIAILIVVLMVGGAAVVEYRKSQRMAAAQQFGDGILTALQSEASDERIAALDTILAEDENSAVLAFVAAAENTRDSNDQAAINRLQAVAQDAALPEIYRHLAELKLLLLQGDELQVADRMARLQALAAPGAPFRLLAEEQMALAEVAVADRGAALTRLRAILVDAELTAGLRRRVSQLIVALGGDLEPA